MDQNLNQKTAKKIRDKQNFIDSIKFLIQNFVVSLLSSQIVMQHYYTENTNNSSVCEQAEYRTFNGKSIRNSLNRNRLLIWNIDCSTSIDLSHCFQIVTSYTKEALQSRRKSLKRFSWCIEAADKSRFRAK